MGRSGAGHSLDRLIMTEPYVERRIAAILAADMVGFSRLMEHAEEAALATLNACRALIEELVARHRGRVFGSAGDSVVAEFASAVEAVRAALEIQTAIAGDQRRARPPAVGAIPDRRQPRRRHGRPRQPAGRRRQRCRPPGSHGRARRRPDLGQRLRPDRGQARPPVRFRRPQDAPQPRPADPRLPLAPARTAGVAFDPLAAPGRDSSAGPRRSPAA